MARKPKKKVDIYCEFDDATFPCNVLAVGQPCRLEVVEGDIYTAVDKVGQNLVILDSRGRELFFHKQWFVLTEE